MHKDHHLHFEGSISFRVLSDILVKNRSELLKTDVKSYFSHKYQCQTANGVQKRLRDGDKDLFHYLTNRFVLKTPTKDLGEFVNRLPTAFIRWACLSINDLELLFSQTVESYLKTHDDIELLFSPRALEGPNFTEEDVVRLFDHIIKSKYSKNVKLVLSLRRDKGDMSLKYVKKCTNDYFLDSIKKLDISGDGSCSLKKFKDSLDVLSKSKFKLCTHIGETSMNDIDFILKGYPEFTQFNHGVYIFRDERLVKIAKKRNIYFTFCPLSSYYTGSMSKLEILEVLKNFIKYKLHFSLGSDDPAIIPGDISTSWIIMEKEKLNI